MAKLSINPLITVFSSGITVDKDATIDTYNTGASTTRQAAYHDVDLSVPHRNPIDLSFLSGSAVVYGDSTTTNYRMVIKDSAGNTLSTTDNLEMMPEPLQITADIDVGSSNIISTGSEDITITSTGSNSITLDGVNWPKQDGSANQTLTTDGLGQTSWTDPGVMVVGDASPQLGGNLDTNSYNIQFDTDHGFKDESGNEQLYFTQTASAVNYLNSTNSATGNPIIIAPAGDDTDIDISIQPKNSGALTFDGITYPAIDGSANSLIRTDGAGTLSFTGTTTELLQRQVTSATTSVSSTSTLILEDDTIPQISEGTDMGIDVSITPESAQSTLIIRLYVAHFENFSVSGNEECIFCLFNEDQSDALAVSYANNPRTARQAGQGVLIYHEEPSSSTSTRIYQVRFANPATETVTINPTWGGGGGPYGVGDAGQYSLIVEEWL